MTISVELFSIDQVDFDKKIFKVIPIFTHFWQCVAHDHFQILLLVFLTVPRDCLQFVIVVFPDHTHLLFLTRRLVCSFSIH